jgi:hypothetical protein
MYFVRPESFQGLGNEVFRHASESIPLRAGTLRYRSLEAHSIAQKSGLGDHDTIVNAEAGSSPPISNRKK